MRSLFIAMLSLLSVPAIASPLLEPTLRFASGDEPAVVVTLDACDGKTDTRILQTLVDNRIPATIFVTGKWLRRNAAAIAVLKAHPDLFEVENHGLNHIPPVDTQSHVFGLRTAGSVSAIRAEVVGGADAIVAAGFPAPKWFRGATAEYSTSATFEIDSLGYRIAGFSLNADQGASLDAATVAKRISGAKAGQVIIAHINQPGRPAGLGVVRGLLDLKARNMRFLKLSEVAEDDIPLH